MKIEDLLWKKPWDVNLPRLLVQSLKSEGLSKGEEFMLVSDLMVMPPDPKALQFLKNDIGEIAAQYRLARTILNPISRGESLNAEEMEFLQKVFATVTKKGGALFQVRELFLALHRMGVVDISKLLMGHLKVTSQTRVASETLLLCIVVGARLCVYDAISDNMVWRPLRWRFLRRLAIYRFERNVAVPVVFDYSRSSWVELIDYLSTYIEHVPCPELIFRNVQAAIDKGVPDRVWCWLPFLARTQRTEAKDLLDRLRRERVSTQFKEACELWLAEFR